MDFNLSPRGQDVLKQVKAFMRDQILLLEDAYFKELRSLENRWVVLPVIDALKAKAKALGLWNLLLPDEEYGAGLLNSDYALIAEEPARSFLAPEIFNCTAQDT